MMNRAIHQFLFYRVTICVLLILSLGWLTVSTPFIYEKQQEEKSVVINLSNEAGNNSENDLLLDPFSGATEEKTESGSSALSEYLLDAEELSAHLQETFNVRLNRQIELYRAFHGELISPPPEIAYS